MKIIIVIVSLLISGLCRAQVAVIVHPNNTSVITEAEIAKIFTGKLKTFNNGQQAIPITLTDDTPTTGEFNKKVLNKSASQLKAYWSKLIFTGKGTPPKVVPKEQDMVALVAENPNLIGYINIKNVNAQVKVIQTF